MEGTLARLLSIGEAELARRIAGFADHAAFCREALTIEDKTGQVVPLILSPAQVKLDAAIQKQERAGKPVRGVVLKARQVHFSVGCATQVFKRVAFLPGQHGIVFADKMRTTNGLFRYYQHFQKGYKTYQGVKQLEPGKAHAWQMLRWAGESSFIQFASAEGGTTGHGYPWRHLHLSEFAFWRDAAMQMTRLMPAVPQDPFTTILVESTANGIGGPFYDMWQRAEDPSERSDWFSLFFAWFEHHEYVRPVEPGTEWSKFERELAQKHNLKPEQLAWRRWAIANVCEGSEDRFHQEFPSTPEEAFLTSGRPRFCHISLGRMPVQRDPVAGELEEIQDGLRKRIQFTPNADDKGTLRIWKMPVPGRRYALGSDPSKGIDVGVKSGKSDPDYWVAPVYDGDTGEQVAMARARLAPYPAAEYTAALGRFYNFAFVVPEANELGFIEALVRLYPLEHLYRRSPDADDKRPPTLHEIGWLTGTNKPQLISMLDAALRSGAISVRDAVTLQELRTFVWKASGKQEAQEGCHDDCVIGTALANVGLNAMPRWKPTNERVEAPKVIDLRGGGSRWRQR